MTCGSICERPRGQAQRGAYTDAVMETVKKIIAGEPVEDFVHPTKEEVLDAISPPRNWIVTLLLCFFLGGFGVHRFYVGKTGIGIATETWLDNRHEMFEVKPEAI